MVFMTDCDTILTLSISLLQLAGRRQQEGAGRHHRCQHCCLRALAGLLRQPDTRANYVETLCVLVHGRRARQAGAHAAHVCVQSHHTPALRHQHVHAVGIRPTDPGAGEQQRRVVQPSCLAVQICRILPQQHLSWWTESPAAGQVHAAVLQLCSRVLCAQHRRLQFSRNSRR